MESSAKTPPNRNAAALVMMLRMQLAQAISATEQHGVELGMLLDTLLELVNRHSQAAEMAVGFSASPLERYLHVQLSADHKTMLSFTGPLLLLRQFHDRLRQRLEHFEQALSSLPTDVPLDDEAFRGAMALFPLDEERTVQARISGLEEPVTEGENVEIFK